MKRVMPSILLLLVLAETAKLSPGKAPFIAPARAASGGLTQMRGLVLWAWERPEDLRFLDPQKHSVAFLATTINLDDDLVSSRARLQPLRLPKGISLMAVARVEAHKPRLTAAQRLRAAEVITALGSLPDISAVQVDFDARESERAFYQGLLHEVRRRLRPEIGLSITALASWCSDDRWLRDLPVDEVVPMLFQMGRDGWAVRSRLAAGRDLPNARCRGSFGLSTNGQFVRLPQGRRIYVFHPRAWSRDAFSRFVEEVKQ